MSTVGKSGLKIYSAIILVSQLLAGCSTPQTTQTPTPVLLIGTEQPCPGVESKGIGTGMQAYFSISGNTGSAPLYQEPNAQSNKAGILYHHIRVTLNNGPNCAASSAWWQVTTPEGKQGWIQIGPELVVANVKYAAEFRPFTGDAVQQEVSESQKLNAQVRYILADIELGDAEVLKYYLDQTTAKPDDPEMGAARIALEIIKKWGKNQILVNPSAFERKPLRGGTSVVDAGTEFVQPGLDIVLQPCDIQNPTMGACKKIAQ